MALMLIVVAAILSTATFFLSNYKNFFGLLPVPAEPATPIASLALSILLFLITERVAYAISAHRAQKDNDALRNAIINLSDTAARTSSISWAGSPDEALVHIMDNDRPVVSVYNTHIKTSVFAQPGRERLFDPDIRRRFHNHRKRLIDNGVEWHDFDGKLMDSAQNDFIEWAAKSPAKRRYYAHQVTFDGPFINFTHFTYRDGGSSVYFGWSYCHDDPAAGRVFLSTDPLLCEYFKAFRIHLSRDFSKPVT